MPVGKTVNPQREMLYKCGSLPQADYRVEGIYVVGSRLADMEFISLECKNLV